MSFIDPIVPEPNWEPIDDRPGRSPFEDDEEEEVEFEEDEDFGFYITE